MKIIQSEKNIDTMRIFKMTNHKAKIIADRINKPYKELLKHSEYGLSRTNETIVHLFK